MTTPPGESVTLDPQPTSDPPSSAPVLSVLRDLIQKAVALKDGTLLVNFVSGAQIKAPADMKYEAWDAGEVGSAKGFMIISMPRGELAIWQGQ